MAYAAVADIQSTLINVGPFAADSKPTITQVTAFIAEVEAEMNSIFASAGIAVPVTDPQKLLVVKKICCDGAAAKVLRSIQMEPDQAVAFQKLYDGALERIRRNPAEIESVSGTGSGGYVTGPAANLTTERHFTREGKDW
jgi:hypothetical protein